MRQLLSLFALVMLMSAPSLLCAQVAALSIDAGENDFAVVAYYSGDANEVDKYPVTKLTHIIYSFLHLQGNRLAVDNAEDDSTIKHLVLLKEKYPRLKVMLALGGWGGCRTCSEVFSNPPARSEFAQSVKALLAAYRADGVDLDWEYPAIEGYPEHSYLLEDKQNFTSLVRELRETLGEQYEVSFAAGGFLEYLAKSVEWEKVVPMVNRVNLMSYDLVNGYSKVTGHHSPLSSSPDQKESIRTAVQFLDSLNIPLNKIAIGAAFYARVWANVDDKNNGLYQAGTFRDFVNYKDFEAYFAATDGFQEHFDRAADAYYRYSPQKKLFATFDNPESVKSKTRYALEQGLGGVMFWQLAADKYRDGLLDAIAEAVKADQ